MGIEGEQFIGKFKLISSENFEEYMKEVGVGFALRKIGNQIKPEVDITITEDNEWTIKTASTFRTVVLTFRLGEPFDEETPDGRKVKCTFVLESATKLIQHQKGQNAGDKDSDIIRELDGKVMKTTLICGDVQCDRRLDRIY